MITVVAKYCNVEYYIELHSINEKNQSWRHSKVRGRYWRGLFHFYSLFLYVCENGGDRIECCKNSCIQNNKQL